MARLTTPLQLLEHPLFEQANISVWIKRDDLNHPFIQGNKLHKLQYNLQAAKRLGCNQLISFGGAYSNHIAALSVAGKENHFKTLAYIRGDELANQPEKWSHTLINAQKNGMEFVFLTRKQYREKNSQTFLQTLKTNYPNAFIIPEGGSNRLAIKGFKQTTQTLEKQCSNWTHLITAVGTGGTLAGLRENTCERKKILGVASLKDAQYLNDEIKKLTKKKNWQLLTDYHGGGYAKTTTEILENQQWFEKTFNIKLDPIYTNKMLNGFLQELRKGHFPAGSTVILYHSGGLQGAGE
jgi:1-aminocyclopropane-1-carboxylate deaminase